MTTQPIRISDTDLRKLLSAASPEAALLYLYISGGNDPASAEQDLGISAARINVRPISAINACGQKLFFTQLIFNFFWSIIYFNLGAYWAAFCWLLILWILVLAMVLCYSEEDRTAAWLQLSYLLWLTFAGYLNFWVSRNN